MVQLTLVTLEEYGKWTHTLGFDREYKLQICQATLYSNLQQLFSQIGGLVIPNRFDEFFAITNNISLNQHATIQQNLLQKVPFEISMSIGSSIFPLIANHVSFESKISNIVTKFPRIYGEVANIEDIVNLIHIDVEGLNKICKRFTPYEISSLINKIQYVLTDYCQTNQLLSFFMGGDNFIVISDDNPQLHSKNISDLILRNLNLIVNCGIGVSKTGRHAMMLATQSLDTIREKRSIGKKDSNIFKIKWLDELLEVH